MRICESRCVAVVEKAETAIGTTLDKLVSSSSFSSALILHKLSIDNKKNSINAVHSWN